VAVASILALEAGQLLAQRERPFNVLGKVPMSARWAAYAAFVLLVVLFGVYQNRQFIYFQF
jgi:hypothetical protein